jgi:hypothetical protein
VAEACRGLTAGLGAEKDRRIDDFNSGPHSAFSISFLQESHLPTECSVGMWPFIPFWPCLRPSRRARFWACSWAFALVAVAVPIQAGIPEPDLVWYGRVLGVSEGHPVRLTAGTLEWQIEPVAGGPALVVSTVLTNINDQFSYVLRIPCETPEPGVGVSTGVVALGNPPIVYGRGTVRLNGQILSLAGAAEQFAPDLTSRGQVERIELHLGTLPEDSDGDGMSDAWEQQYFGPAGAEPGDDADGDGMDNLAEYRAGTNPTDGDSRFEVVTIELVTGGVLLEWTSEAGRRYRVKRSTSLFAVAADYEVVRTGIEATPPLNQFTDVTTGANELFFYRIQLED